MADVFNFYVRDDRKIDFHSPEPIMQEDKDVAVWKFRIPKVLNQIDMSNWAWWFVYINSKGHQYSESLTLTDDVDEPDAFSVAEYSIDYGISKHPGSFTFALEAINADQGGEITGEWHTYTYSHKVIGTLQGNQAEFAETESDIISALIVELRSRANALVGGATPQVVSSVSAMTDTSKIYVLSTDGNWYWYNGSVWQSGGQYASGITIDPTLTQSGQAADAKETGKVRNDVIFDETTLLQAPLSIAKFEAYSYWTFGSRIAPTTGVTSNNEPAYCRSTWVTITEPILVTMTSQDYEWCVWGYSNNASAAGTYSPSPVYSDRPVIIRPIKGTTYFRLSVRRKDLATLTTPYSDQTSDAYKILTSLKTLVLTDDTLSVAGVPADAKAVGDMIASLTVAEGTAWD